MKPVGSLASNVASVVFAPTAGLAALIAVGYVFSGMALYVFCMGAAYTMGLFKRFVEWPEISRVTLFAGPVLIGVGLYFATQPSSSAYWMLVPVWIYIALGMVGGFALRRLR